MSTWEAIHGDCLEELQGMDAGSVDCVVTDPPYGTGAWKRGVPGAGQDCTAKHQREEWDIWDLEWLDQAWRVSRGRVGMFCAQTNLPSLIAWCGNRTWRMGVWVKTDPRPRFQSQPAYGFECFLCIGGLEACGGIDVVQASSPRLNRDHDGTRHPHQKPIRAVRWALNMCAPEGCSVLDPYMGSGTTGVACMQTGRNFIGIEIDEGYCETARARIGEASNHLFANVTA